MGFTEEEVNAVYNKTDGYCKYCGKRLSFVNYGKNGKRGAWHIDHSKAWVKGGSSYLRNLVREFRELIEKYWKEFENS